MSHELGSKRQLPIYELPLRDFNFLDEFELRDKILEQVEGFSQDQLVFCGFSHESSQDYQPQPRKMTYGMTLEEWNYFLDAGYSDSTPLMYADSQDSTYAPHLAVYDGSQIVRDPNHLTGGGIVTPFTHKYGDNVQDALVAVIAFK